MEINEHELKELEHLRSINESRAVYQKLNKSREDFESMTTLYRGKKGILLSRNEAMLERWLEYLDELLNTNAPDQLEGVDKTWHLEDIKPAEQKPAVAEMEVAIRKRKNNKAPGMDFLQVEMTKSTMGCPVLPAVQHST
jgi:GTP cyclohydrolase FolE2